MIELDNTMLLFVGGENHSGRLMLGSRVRIPSGSQNIKIVDRPGSSHSLKSNWPPDLLTLLGKRGKRNLVGQMEQET